MRRMRERRADISPHDSAERLRAAGVDVYFGDARFTSRVRRSMWPARTLTFRRAVIATGGRPAVPPIPGLAAAPYLTNETLFGSTEQPRRLAIIGAGPIGCEMAQAFARLGSAVTLVDQAAQVLPQEDADAAAIVARRLAADGVTLRLGADGRRRLRQHGERRIVCSSIGRRRQRARRCDQLLVAVGRTPNVERLDLAAAGVAFDKAAASPSTIACARRTAAIFAAGDVCSPFKFTHAADALARIVIQNALFFGRARASALVIPWCTYTDPEVAHVGACGGGAAAGPPRRDDHGSARRGRSRGRRRGAATASCGFTTTAAGCSAAPSSRRAPAR